MTSRSWSACSTAGSAISEGVLNRARNRFPGVRLTQAYGQTEAAPVVTLLLPDRDDPAQWPDLGKVFEAAFASRSRDDWADTFDGVDACVTPVPTFAEAANNAHMAAREPQGDTDFSSILRSWRAS